ncbi:MAG: polysulfide reductase NrfD [Dehalococcoidales bacterium]|nr:polysulfide reductase NrfD [Dehalococcoidales bacterium]
MTTDFVALEGKSRGYRFLIAVLAVLAVAGFVSFIISYIQGHQVFGSNNVIPWGMPIVLTIYLIGLSAGSLILSSLTYVFGREEYRPIARMAVFLAIVLIFGAMLSIALDLGRPEKFWRLFMFFYMNNMSSMFAINGILYGGYFIISLVYLGIIFAGSHRASRITGIIAAGWAILVHLGTGAIFGIIAAREAWFSPVKPVEFLAAALTSGAALLIVAVTLILVLSGREVKKKMVSSLGRLLMYFIVILLVLIIVDKLIHLYSAHREATLYMLTGQYSWIFWCFQIGLGVVIPLAILLNPRINKVIGWVVTAAVSVVIGVFFERYYLVIPGAAYPMQYYPGKIEGVWGATGSFPLTPVEMVLSVGIIAFLIFIFIMGLKYLELLPPGEPAKEAVKEGKEEAEQADNTAETSEGQQGNDER